MKTNTMNSYIADELANKIKYLHLALEQAKNIISQLETENNRLQDAIISLASENKEDYVFDNEILNGPLYTV